MILALLLAASVPARAEIPLSMTFGGIGVIDTAGGGWIGEYAYFGPSALVDLGGNIALIPQLTLELSPGHGNWGFVGTATLEWAADDRVGIDLVPSIVQDTVGGSTAWILAAGPGATYLFENGMSFSVAAQVNYVLTEDLPLTLNPLVQIAVPVP